MKILKITQITAFNLCLLCLICPFWALGKPFKINSLVTKENWSSSGATISTAPIFNGQPALSMTVSLKGKPTSKWFKISSNITSRTVGNWHLFDSFDFYAMAKTDRPEKNLPPIRLVCKLIGKKGKMVGSAIIKFPQLDKWVHVSIPIREMKGLGKLQNIQFQFAKKWAKYPDEVTFSIAGFQLIKNGNNSNIEPVLLTQSLSLNEPLLYLRAGNVSHITIDNSDNEKIKLDPVGENDRELSLDISDMGLNAGIHKITVFNSQSDQIKTFSFEWLPIKVLSADIGRAVYGINTATAEIRNAAKQPVALKGMVKFNGNKIATKKFEIPPGKKQLLEMDWPLVKKQGGMIQFEILLNNKANSSISLISKKIDIPKPLGKIASHMAIIFDPEKETRFRLPIAISTKSPSELKWSLMDDKGIKLYSGTTKFNYSDPIITIPKFEMNSSGRFLLSVRLNEETKTVKIYFVEKLH